MPSTPPPRSPWLRWGVTLAGLAALALFALLYGFVPGAYFHLLFWLGDNPYRYPFLDLESILMAARCWHQGVDVYHANACMQGGGFSYAPLLLRAGYLPIGPQDRLAGGICLILAFLAAQALLPPPPNARAAGLRILATLSPATLFAAERGNFDLAVFALMALALAATARGPALRLVGYLLLALTGALKFYPAAGLVLVLRESPARLTAIILLVAALAMADWLAFAHNTATALAQLPGGPPFGYWFGDSNLGYGLALLGFAPSINLDPNIAQYRFVLLHNGALPIAKAITLALIWGATAAMILRARRVAPILGSGAPWVIAAAAVICGCFFSAQNVVYRDVFLLFALPALERSRPGLLAALLLLFWEEALRRWLTLGVVPEIAFWLLREALWWAVIIELGAILLRYGWDETHRKQSS